MRRARTKRRRLAAAGGPRLEGLAEFFYDPVVFWSVPLALVALRAGIRRVGAWVRRGR